MVSTLTSLSATFANLLWSALGVCFLSLCLYRKDHFFWLSHSLEEKMKGRLFLGTRPRSIKLMSFSQPPPPLHQHAPPAMLSFSISPFCPFLLPGVSLSQRAQAFLTWPGRFDDWGVQIEPRWQARSSRLEPLQISDVSFLPSLLQSLSLSFTYNECPRHEVAYTGRCPGNPGPAHYPAPVRHSSW